MWHLLAILSLFGAPPPEPPELPQLWSLSPTESQARWMDAKSKAAPFGQVDSVRAQRLNLSRCEGLIDLRANIASVEGGVIGYRDDIRGRQWARPSLTLLLRESLQHFFARHPERKVVFGDIAQPGCGQISHNIIVKELSPTAAKRWLQDARWHHGQLRRTTELLARDFPDEADRFEWDTQPVLVTQDLIGLTHLSAQADTDTDAEHTDLGVLRYAQHRYRQMPAPTPESQAAFVAEVASLLKQPSSALEPLYNEGPDGQPYTTWVRHHIDRRQRRQMRIYFHTSPSDGFQWSQVDSIRLANWQNKKPGSMPGEVRWVPHPLTRALPPPTPLKANQDPAPTEGHPPPVFTLWRPLLEAGHISHLSGIDADIGYIMREDRHHFALAVSEIDPEATWAWFESLEAVSLAHALPIEVIFLDHSVIQHLRQAFRKVPAHRRRLRSKLWRRLQPLSGHASHHHLRLKEVSEAQERQALQHLLND